MEALHTSSDPNTEEEAMDYMAAQMDSQIEGAQHAYEAAMQEGQQPAYPAQERIDYPSSSVMVHHTGMTLRDSFAQRAIQGFLANPGGPYQACDQSGWRLVNCTLDQVASEAYAMADAMLKARTK